jgi:integrase
VRDHQSTLEISRFMGHSKVTTTLTIYSYLFPSDHAGRWLRLTRTRLPK